MTFSWKIPPWERHEDCSYLAVTLMDEGDGQFRFSTEGVRGDDAIEAVADLLMSPGSLLGLVPSFPALIGVVVRRGIDSTWLAQPPVQAARDDRGRWQIAVPEGSALFLSTPGVREEFASRFGPDPGHTASAA